MNGIEKAAIQLEVGTRPIIEQLDSLRLHFGFSSICVKTPLVESRLRSGLLPKHRALHVEVLKSVSSDNGKTKSAAAVVEAASSSSANIDATAVVSAAVEGDFKAELTSTESTEGRQRFQLIVGLEFSLGYPEVPMNVLTVAYLQHADEAMADKELMADDEIWAIIKAHSRKPAVFIVESLFHCMTSKLQCAQQLHSPDIAVDITDEQPESLDSVMRIHVEAMFRCRGCRQLLFDSKELHSHSKISNNCEDYISYDAASDSQQVITAAAIGSSISGSMIPLVPKVSAPSPCTSYFLEEPPAWLFEKTAQDGDRIICPKCRMRLGNWSWSGAQCGCRHEWITPSFQFTKSKIDIQYVTVSDMKTS